MPPNNTATIRPTRPTHPEALYHTWNKFNDLFSKRADPVCPSQGCLMLEVLSSELLLLIAEQTDTVDQRILAQTCTALRNILCSYQLYLSDNKVTQEQHIEYITRVGRGNPTARPRELRHGFHPFPHKESLARFLDGVMFWTKGLVSKEGLYPHPYWPRWFQVQLALELHRLPKRSSFQENYYKKRMGSFCYRLCSAPHRESTVGVCGMFPKIVDGRYFLKMVQRFEDSGSRPSGLRTRYCRNINIRACAHQQLTRLPSHNYYREALAWRDAQSPPESAQVYERLRLACGHPRLPHEEMEMAAMLAQLHEGFVVERSCPQCPTDFSVQICGKTIVVCAWHDLGGSSFYFDPAWEIHKMQRTTSTPPYWLSRPIYHEPWSVKERYENC